MTNYSSLIRDIISFFLIIITVITVVGTVYSQKNKNLSQYAVEFLTKNKKVNNWVFIMAGQSNMAGRAVVDPADTINSQRILTINGLGNFIPASEPLHNFEEGRKGLDCGVSFANQIIAHISDSINIILIPVAVGGSSINKWIGDSIHRNIKLLSNFRYKLQTAAKYGTLKAILWHQGESDATADRIVDYKLKLKKIFALFRNIANDDSLPVLTGHIGVFNLQNECIKSINNAIDATAAEDENVYTIITDDFTHIGDNLHFDALSQRKMGIRMAQKYIETLK